MPPTTSATTQATTKPTLPPVTMPPTTSTTSLTTPTTTTTPKCSDGDVSVVCDQLADGGTWTNATLLAWYGCLAENCMDQTDLWHGYACTVVLSHLTCDDDADQSGHTPGQQQTRFVGTVGDACPRSCKPECQKCNVGTAPTTTTTTTTKTTTTTTPEEICADSANAARDSD